MTRLEAANANRAERVGAPVGNADHERPKLTVMALALMLIVVMVLSTIHLGVLIAQEIWAPPRFLIRVQGLLEIFGYFLLVLIGG
jgi:hypothetical protein